MPRLAMSVAAAHDIATQLQELYKDNNIAVTADFIILQTSIAELYAKLEKKEADSIDSAHLIDEVLNTELETGLLLELTKALRLHAANQFSIASRLVTCVDLLDTIECVDASGREGVFVSDDTGSEPEKPLLINLYAGWIIKHYSVEDLIMQVLPQINSVRLITKHFDALKQELCKATMAAVAEVYVGDDNAAKIELLACTAVRSYMDAVTDGSVQDQHNNRYAVKSLINDRKVLIKLLMLGVPNYPKLQKLLTTDRPVNAEELQLILSYSVYEAGLDPVQRSFFNFLITRLDESAKLYFLEYRFGLLMLLSERNRAILAEFDAAHSVPLSEALCNKIIEFPNTYKNYSERKLKGFAVFTLDLLQEGLDEQFVVNHLNSHTNGVRLQRLVFAIVDLHRMLHQFESKRLVGIDSSVAQIVDSPDHVAVRKILRIAENWCKQLLVRADLSHIRDAKDSPFFRVVKYRAVMQEQIASLRYLDLLKGLAVAGASLRLRSAAGGLELNQLGGDLDWSSYMHIYRTNPSNIKDKYQELSVLPHISQLEAHALLQDALNTDGCTNLVIMILEYLPKSTVSIELLESILPRLVTLDLTPENKLLLIVTIQHLSAHPDWNHYGVVTNLLSNLLSRTSAEILLAIPPQFLTKYVEYLAEPAADRAKRLDVIRQVLIYIYAEKHSEKDLVDKLFTIGPLRFTYYAEYLKANFINKPSLRALSTAFIKCLGADLELLNEVVGGVENYGSDRYAICNFFNEVLNVADEKLLSGVKGLHWLLTIRYRASATLELDQSQSEKLDASVGILRKRGVHELSQFMAGNHADLKDWHALMQYLFGFSWASSERSILQTLVDEFNTKYKHSPVYQRLNIQQYSTWEYTKSMFFCCKRRRRPSAVLRAIAASADERSEQGSSVGEAPKIKAS